ncbi:MAG: type II secretion system F family protein [Armatimonadetes bacterium]|nr:type II secretion system F family protein [Armatimonadota bacterium]
MGALLLLAVMILVGLAIASLLAGMLGRSQATVIEERVTAVAQRRSRIGDAIRHELSMPLRERLLAPWMRQLGGAISGGSKIGAFERFRRQLDRAGYPYGLTTETFMGLRGLSVLIFGGLGLWGAFMWHAPLVMRAAVGLLGVTAGVFLPQYLLDQHIRKRQQAIRKSLPDIMDLLVVCTEAGVGLDTALQEVIRRRQGPLVYEFDRLLSEVRMGKSRAQAWQDLAERTGVEEVRMLVTSLLQAEQLGVSIAKTLRTQANALRNRRSMKVRIAAAGMAVKMLFPLVFFIFPAVFTVVLGPAVVSISENFHLFGR